MHFWALSTAFLLLAEAQARAPLNVVLIDICSARADHFGSYGYSRPTTPGLDKLARESAVFDNAMAQASWCLPNYATLFTGHVPEVHGQYMNIPHRPLPEFETTLAQRLKEAGYRTGAFTGGIYFLPAWELSRGFDTFVNSFSTSSALPGSFAGLAPKALDWIKAGASSPFFLYAAVDDLHAPYQAEDSERFDPGYEGVVHDTATLSVRFFRAYNGEPLEATDPIRLKLDAFRQDPRHLLHLTAHYDAALSGVDRKVSAFLDRLKGLGLWDKTLVIVTADHGELLGEKALLGHTEGLYEPVLRVPLLIHHPALTRSKPSRPRQVVQRSDLFPTILESAGIDPASVQAQGRSLLPLLRDPKGAWRPYAYASSKRNMSTLADSEIDERVLREGRWKLHWYSYKEGFELYDLESDPQERNDLSAARPEIVKRLAFQLLKHVEALRPRAPGPPSSLLNPAGKGLESRDDPH
ncbi:MAG: sulfatase [Elusimicrobia bacterium]|nr:sulfatase [Elusimicrobiota bacterium]